ncbi:hypothetical protein [Sulfitobacter delicatus]|uniref:Uncharacterized protein n=1 Tax=Sulfitobacter delicatus TaxID=218672 RepID=A0A1G7UYA1_9RHOB|nr:hypothetical protein [Sulfitobacter delicatus]SDG52099.1 hypothetical protein SAMN04489759_108144 [Sulfitobacter delicatus]
MIDFLLTLDRLKALKRQALMSIPHAKAAHRTEIVARFLGWRTYASLLHDLRSEGQFIDNFDYSGAIDFSRQIDIDLDTEDLGELAERLQDEFGSEADYSKY